MGLEKQEINPTFQFGTEERKETRKKEKSHFNRINGFVYP